MRLVLATPNDAEGAASHTFGVVALMLPNQPSTRLRRVSASIQDRLLDGAIWGSGVVRVVSARRDGLVCREHDGVQERR